MNQHFTYTFRSDLSTLAILERLRPASTFSWRIEPTGDLAASAPDGGAVCISAADPAGQRLLALSYPSDQPPARERYQAVIETVFAVLLPAIEALARGDSSMVRIPSGRVLIGLTEAEADRLARDLAHAEITLLDEREEPHRPLDEVIAVRRNALRISMPAYEVAVGEFWISRYPVTVDEYAKYVQATGASEPLTWQLMRPPARTFVTGISWTEAAAYATFHNAELPTEAEWEHAARNGRSFFTWGDSYFPEGRLAYPENQLDAPWPVGSRPQLASVYGVEDMLGTYGEFTASPLGPYPDADPVWFERRRRGRRNERTVRGGYDVEQDSTTVFRGGVGEDERVRDVKFRLVRRNPRGKE